MRDTLAEGIGDPLGHRRHGKAAVEAEAEATQVAPGVLVEIEGVKGPVQAGFEVAEDGVDPAELWKVIRMLATSDIGVMAEASGRDRAEVGQGF